MDQILLTAVFVKTVLTVQVVTYLIAYAVNHHTGMVTGSLHHGTGIGLPPLIKIEIVTLLGMIFWGIPGIKRLRHYKKSHSVTKVHQDWICRIVGHPYGIHTKFAQLL